MNSVKINRTLMQGQIAGRGKLYNEGQCPFPVNTRLARLWKAGFDNGRDGKPISQETGYGDNRTTLPKS